MEPSVIPASGSPLSPRQRRRSVGAGFLYFGIYFVVQTTVSTAYVFIQMLISLLRSGISFDPMILVSQSLDNAAILSGLCNLITLVIYWVFFSARRCHFGMETQLFRVNIPALLLMIPLGLSCYTFIVCILSLLPENLLQSYISSAEGLLGSSSPLAILSLVVLAPLAEEVAFRGLLYTRLRRGMPRLLALFLASFLFGLMHGQFVWMLYAFVLSLLLCAILDWFGSLWPGILLHMTFNAGQYVAAPFLEQIDFLPLLCGSILLLVPLLLLVYRIGRRTRRRPLS